MRSVVITQELPQSLISVSQRLGELTVSIFTLKVRVKPALFVVTHVVTFVTDTLELWRTHCVHSFGSGSGRTEVLITGVVEWLQEVVNLVM